MNVFSDPITTAIGGGVTGVLALWVGLMITGRLSSPSFYVSEIEKRDKIIADERAYSKQVVNDLQDVNRSVREDVVPAMTTMNAQVTAITTLLQQDLLLRGSKS